jgi:hypothetical protein
MSEDLTRQGQSAGTSPSSYGDASFVEIRPVVSEQSSDVAEATLGAPNEAGGWSIWLWLILLAPAVCTAWYILRFGVNVPFMDDWETPWAFSMLQQGGNGLLHFFWEPNNEHREVVPKMIWTFLGYPSHWNLMLGMFVNLLCVVWAFWGITRLAARQSINCGAVLYASTLATGILLFSFVHYDTWLWEQELTFVLAVCCSIGAVLVLAIENWSTELRIAVALGLCFAASFSAAHGMLSWLIILPVIVSVFQNRHRGLMACLLVLMALALTCGLYLINYHPNRTFSSDPREVLKHPLHAVQFFCALLGAPIAQFATMNPAKVAPWLGAVLCAGFAGLLVLAVHRRIFRPIAPWFAIGLYGLGFAVMTTIGRFTWGIAIASTMSRYMICSVLLSVAIVQLMRVFIGSYQHAEVSFFAIAIAFIAAEFAAYPSLVRKGSQLYGARSDAALYLEIAPYIDPATDESDQGLLFPLFPVLHLTKAIRTNLPVLNDLGFRKVAVDAIFTEDPPFCGCLDSPIATSNHVFPISYSSALPVTGWAILPNRNKLPEIVMLSVDDRQTFIWGARVGTRDRPDVRLVMKNPSLGAVGWSTMIPSGLLPSGEFTLKAWAYDSDHERFLKLSDCTGPKRILRIP